MVKTIVVLGAGLVGVPLAHYLLTKIAAKHSDIDVVLVAPNEEFYWKLASVRFIAAPALIPEEKYLFPIAEQFAKYPRDKFEFVLGRAEALDPAQSAVTVRLNDGGGARTIPYHTLVVATGSRYREAMPWKDLATTRETRAAIAQLQRDVQAARSIVVAGAGVTGVEFAGELGSEFARAGTKEVTIVSADPLPLEPRLMESVRRAAKQELGKLGVKFVGGARITGTSDSGSDSDGGGRKTVELTGTDGSKRTIAADLVIPTYGAVPNSEFAPAGMRDAASGQLRQDRFLRAPGHDNVFVLGDVGSLQPSQAANAEPQLRHLMKQLDPYLRTGKVEEYKFDPDKVVIALTVGRDRGTGQMGSVKPWSWIVWALKGRHLGTNYSAPYAAGEKGMNGAWP